MGAGTRTRIGTRRSSEVRHPTRAGVRVLIVGPAWVGDMVMAQPLVAALHGAGDDVHVLAPAATLAVAERLAGVTAAHRLDAGRGALALAARWRAGRDLARLGFERAIVLPNSFKSALAPWFARIPLRTGWRGEHRFGVLNDLRRPAQDQPARQADRFLALAARRSAHGGEPTPAPCQPRPRLVVDPGNLAKVRAKLALAPAPQALALCPGAEYGPAKRWPPRHFAAVAARGLAAGHQVWLFGAPAERRICDEIAALAPGVRNLAGRTGLGDAIDLLSLAHCVVANDSGLMHVAGALGRPVVALYGATSPDLTPPLGNVATVLRPSLPCSPCFERVCPLGHTRCLTDLAPDTVWQALDTLARRRPRANA